MGADERVPVWRRVCWWAADYAYAGWRQLAIVTAAHRSRYWLRGDETLPEIVLLPGVYEHWTFLRPLGDRLNRAGYRVRTVHGLGVNRRPIAETAEKLGRALERLPEAPAGRVIVGHSKGGLIGKQLLVSLAAAGRPHEIAGLVAICTPFGGARRARLFVDPSIREFLPGDATIHALGQAREVDSCIVSVYGRWDPHLPDGSALPGARNIEVAAAGHFRVLGAAETAAAVIDGITSLVPAQRAR